MLHETLIRLHTQRCHASFQTECIKSQLTTDTLITALWHSLLKSLLSHSNTLEPPEMQTLCDEMLEKLAYCHSLITSDRLLNQESTWSYESRASWSNYVRKVLNQTGPSGLWMWDFWAKVSRYNVPGKNPFILGHDSLPSGDSFACRPSKTYVSCADTRFKWPEDRTLFTAVHKNIWILSSAPGRPPKLS